MSSREYNTIRLVACPTCYAPRGQVCLHPDGRPRMEYGRPMCCKERRAAWQLARDLEGRRAPAESHHCATCHVLLCWDTLRLAWFCPTCSRIPTKGT